VNKSPKNNSVVLLISEVIYSHSRLLSTLDKKVCCSLPVNPSQGCVFLSISKRINYFMVNAPNCINRTEVCIVQPWQRKHFIDCIQLFRELLFSYIDLVHIDCSFQLIKNKLFKCSIIYVWHEISTYRRKLRLINSDISIFIYPTVRTMS
jgi:hypothetical protein